jgi:hypothetical protein
LNCPPADRTAQEIRAPSVSPGDRNLTLQFCPGESGTQNGVQRLANLLDVGVAGSNPVTPTSKSKACVPNHAPVDWLRQLGTHWGLGATPSVFGASIPGLRGQFRPTGPKLFAGAAAAGSCPYFCLSAPLTQRDRLRLDGVVGSSATAAKPVPTSLKANSPRCGDYRSVIVDERSMPTEELLAALIGQCQRTDDVRHLRAR